MEMADKISPSFVGTYTLSFAKRMWSFTFPFGEGTIAALYFFDDVLFGDENCQKWKVVVSSKRILKTLKTNTRKLVGNGGTLDEAWQNLLSRASEPQSQESTRVLKRQAILDGLDGI